jgi:hypothetical protein
MKGHIMNPINDEKTHNNMSEVGQQKTNRISSAVIYISQITTCTKNGHKRE